MTDLTAVSLFAGVGGFDGSLGNHGVKVVAAVEIDAQCREVLARRFPDTKLFPDVTEVTGADLRTAGFVPERGIICGGFPCQDVSTAGKRAGLAGARSGLFWQIVRLVDELQPKWVFLENVVGLLSSGYSDECANPKCGSCDPGRDMGEVIGALVDRGYGVAYRVLDAEYFGVPQRRRRVFIVGCLGDDGRASEKVLAITESLCRDSAPSGAERKDVADDVEEGAPSGRIFGKSTFAGYNESVMTLTASQRQEDNIVVSAPRIFGTLTREASSTKMQSDTHIVAFSHTQGMDAQPSNDVFPTLRKEGAGHAVMTVSLASDPIHGDVAEPVTGRHGGPGVVIYDEQEVAENLVVRRLTPLECERLQGFPDGHTDGQSDTVRYRQMGNAVAVPCVDWIVKRLVEKDSELSTGNVAVEA